MLFVRSFLTSSDSNSFHNFFSLFFTPKFLIIWLILMISLILFNWILLNLILISRKWREIIITNILMFIPILFHYSFPTFIALTCCRTTPSLMILKFSQTDMSFTEDTNLKLFCTISLMLMNQISFNYLFTSLARKRCMFIFVVLVNAINVGNE